MHVGTDQLGLDDFFEGKSNEQDVFQDEEAGGYFFRVDLDFLLQAGVDGQAEEGGDGEDAKSDEVPIQVGVGVAQDQVAHQAKKEDEEIDQPTKVGAKGGDGGESGLVRAKEGVELDDVKKQGDQKYQEGDAEDGWEERMNPHECVQQGLGPPLVYIIDESFLFMGSYFLKG